MQIYMDILTDDGEEVWKMYIDPNISLDGSGITLNGTFYRYIKIVRVSIDGNEKIFKEAFLWAKRSEVIPEECKELLNLKNLSIPAMTFLVEHLAPKCIEPLSKDIGEISEIDLKKYARGVAVHLARKNREQ